MQETAILSKLLENDGGLMGKGETTTITYRRLASATVSEVHVQCVAVLRVNVFVYNMKCK